MKLRDDYRRKAWGPGKWRKRAQDAFNQLVRIQAADTEGQVTCVTCGARGYWDEAKSLGMSGMDAGHWRPGHSVAFLTVNVHPQCVECNQHLSSNAPAYDRFMTRVYGQAAMDYIIRLSKQPANYQTAEWLRLMEYQCRIQIETELARLR